MAASTSANTGTGTHTVRGYCALCTAHCATVATVVDGRVTRLEPDHVHPHGGVMCLKGKAAPELVYNPARLNHPLRRTRPKGDSDPGWERVSWDDALDDIAQRLLDIRNRHGARAIALARGTPSGTSLDDGGRWLTRFMNLFGSPNTVSTTHVCNWHKDTGLTYTFGVDQPIPDLEHSGAFMLWGHNPSYTSLILANDIFQSRRRGMKMVAVDPRKTGTAGGADVLLQVRPGSDGALALAMIHVLIEESLLDETFVREWTNAPWLLRCDTGLPLTQADLTVDGDAGAYVVWDEDAQNPAASTSSGGCPAIRGERVLLDADGKLIRCRTAFDALAELAAEHAPECSESVTWVAAASVREAVRLLAANRPVSMFMWNGIGQHTNATQTGRAIGILYALLGDFDAPGGNVIFPTVSVNDVGAAGKLPDEVAAARIGRQERPLGPPANPGSVSPYDFATAVLEETPYPVKALVTFGANPVMSSGDSQWIHDALCSLELGVTVELFMTPTAQLSDYVLPAASFLEMDNLATGFRHRPKGKLHMQYRPAVVEPLKERRSDAWVAFELAKRMGMATEFWDGDLQAAYAYELEPTGITLEVLKAEPGGITVDGSTRYRKHAEVGEDGTPRGFRTPSRKVEVFSTLFAEHGYDPLPTYVEPAMSPISQPGVAADYPIVLTNAKVTTFIHSQLRSLPSLRRNAPHPTADVHPDTAARFAVADEEWMVVETPRGAIRVKARVTKTIPAGIVCVQSGWWQACEALELPRYDPYDADGANASMLIGHDLQDPISGSLPHRSYLCRIRPLQAPTAR
jgi:anaerobic selenocysteine-containing dehydrogenase